jgi:hypothetical protein
MPLIIRLFKQLDGASNNNIDYHDSIEDDLEVLFDLSHSKFKET